MKLIEHMTHGHFAFGLLASAFGVFFLIANLVPCSGMLRFWPIFLIVAGLLKAFGACMCRNCNK